MIPTFRSDLEYHGYDFDFTGVHHQYLTPNSSHISRVSSPRTSPFHAAQIELSPRDGFNRYRVPLNSRSKRTAATQKVQRVYQQTRRPQRIPVSRTQGALPSLPSVSSNSTPSSSGSTTDSFFAQRQTPKAALRKNYHHPTDRSTTGNYGYESAGFRNQRSVSKEAAVILSQYPSFTPHARDRIQILRARPEVAHFSQQLAAEVDMYGNHGINQETFSLQKEDIRSKLFLQSYRTASDLNDTYEGFEPLMASKQSSSSQISVPDSEGFDSYAELETGKFQQVTEEIYKAPKVSVSARRGGFTAPELNTVALQQPLYGNNACAVQSGALSLHNTVHGQGFFSPKPLKTVSSNGAPWVSLISPSTTASQRQRDHRSVRSVSISPKTTSSILPRLDRLSISPRTKVTPLNGNNSRLSSPDRSKFAAKTKINSQVSIGEEFDKGQVSQTKQPIANLDEDLYLGFIKWLKDNGAKFPDLYLKTYSDDIRGVHCKKFVDAYQTIVSIPQHCLITDYMGQTETLIGRKLFASDYSLSTPNLISVVIYILTTRDDPNHFFQPYYKTLPKLYSNFPIFWDEEKLSWLEGSPLLEDIAQRKRNIRSDYDEICRICLEFKKYSFSEFLKIRTAVGSRNFGIVLNGDKRTAMVPFADMLNHYRPRETSWTFENSRDAFTITSLSPLQPGQQVMDSYGKKCNSKFFLHYGFAVEVNREEDGKCQNEITLRCCLRNSHLIFMTSQKETQSQKDKDVLSRKIFSRLVEQKMTLLANIFNLNIQNGLCISKSFSLSMNYEDGSTSDILSFLRVKAATELEMHRIVTAAECAALQRLSGGFGSTCFRSRHGQIPVVSAENEVRMLERLGKQCKEQLERYSSTYEENLELLKSGTVKQFSDKRTALVVVLGEQEICHFWLYALKTLRPILLRKKPSVQSNSFDHIVDDFCSLPADTDRERDLRRYALHLAEQLRVQDKFRVTTSGYK